MGCLMPTPARLLAGRERARQARLSGAVPELAKPKPRIRGTRAKHVDLSAADLERMLASLDNAGQQVMAVVHIARQGFGGGWITRGSKARATITTLQADLAARFRLEHGIEIDIVKPIEDTRKRLW